MDLRKLRDKATDAFARGKFAKAAELYTELCRSDKRDMQARLRMGDAWARAGDKPKAVEAYRVAAETFAKDGFLPRAIAATKLILEIDPSHQSTQKMLADLFARKSKNGTEALDDSPLLYDQVAREGKAGARRRAIDLPPADKELPLEANSLTPPKRAEPHRPPESQPAPAEIELRVEEEVPPPAKTDTAANIPPGPSSTETKAPAGSRFDELDLNDAGESGPMHSAESLLQTVEAAARSHRPESPKEKMAPPDAEGPSGDGLPKIPLFSDLPHAAFIQLFERCPLRRLRQGERIIEQGSIGHAFYVICAGRVRVYRDDEGRRVELATLEEGAFFGEMALLSGAARTASVEGISEDTQILEIAAPVLAQLSGEFPQVAEALKKFCRQRLLTNVMNTSAFFRPFNSKERRELVERFRAREVPKGFNIVREGSETDGLYVILSGEVEVQRSGKLAAKLKEGDIFGEISLLRKTPASASVVSRKRTSLLRLPREEFDALILSHPQLLVLISELTEDRQQQNEVLSSGAAVLGDEGLMLV